MESSSEAEALLDRLDTLLVDCVPKEVGNASGDEYTAGLHELKKACASHIKKAEEAVTKRVCQLVSNSRTSSASKTSSQAGEEEPFTVLSIGCGDGTFDARILQAMLERYPDIKISYIGTDIDQDTCQKALKELGELKDSYVNRVTIKTITMDFEDIDSVRAEIPPCDLVLAVHVFYYMKDLRKALVDAQKLAKPKHGSVFVLMTTRDCPVLQLRRFWQHEHGWPMRFPDAATDNLRILGIEFETELIDAELDLTQCFRDGFQKPHQKFLLDFITHARMDRYPTAISQLCVEYIRMAAIGKPEKYIIPFSVTFIVYKNF